MYLFAGSSHQALAESLAKELRVPLRRMTKKTFSSGERYVRFGESVRGKDVYILQTATKQPNEDLMELFLICQAAKLSFARSVHVLIPHFPYARQDRVAEPREPISAKLVARLLETSGADHVLTLDLHSDQIQGFFTIPVDALDGRPVFAAYFRAKKQKDFVVVSPDAGGAKRAKKFADLIGAELAFMHKTRPKHQESQVMEVVGEVENRTCIIFDDMIDTGGSLIGAKKALIKRGANKDVFAVATHAVFGKGAHENLKKAGFREIVVTDSMPVEKKGLRELTILPIAPMLAEVVHHIDKGESVTDMYGRK